MPMYAYACKDCGHAFDIQQSFSDDSLTVCPECGGALRKKFNSVGVVFKGTGFYRNDSRDTKTSVEAGSSSATSDSGTKAKVTSDSSAGTGSSSSSPSTSSATPSGGGTASS
ncbi:FmdB family zinc ribbon protein [Arthrobacter sp. B1805]|uniref:FmdB family zinc ribbon protein n=1 Tax=Arthrobacter sp. B1805 TaxID=2058892 RepID=UPI000CE47FE2|nr:FmdB family zinc ribbon protein [Arthrobacter sp. B1805]